MLKRRIVGVIIIKNGIAIQSIGFNKYLPVGSVAISVEFLNKWGIDEIVLLDIDKTRQNQKPDFKLITKISKKSFVPLTVGGGIRNLDDIKKLIHYGADKVSINRMALTNPDIIKSAAAIFGNQCIVVSIDVKKVKGEYRVFSNGGKKFEKIKPLELARQAENLGAGEILINSIDRDGSKSGYDVKIIQQISNELSIPVIACGGAGHPKHFLEVFQKTNAMAAAAGNFFHFTEHSPIIVKTYLMDNSVDIRLDTQANYREAGFFKDGRVSKRSDDYLDKLRFEYIQPEKI